MRRVANIIFIFLTIALAITIFLLSSDTGEESGSKSSSITEMILSILVKDFDDMSLKERQVLINKYSFLIRKLAHFSEYAAFGFLLYGSYYSLNTSIVVKKRMMILNTWLFATLYAVTDELHQKYVAGRGPSIRDVMIDSMGALFGILVFLFLVNVIKTIKKNKLMK